MTLSGIAKHFDLSMRDQVEASIKNGHSDSFFIFSGPPMFEKLGNTAAEANPALTAAETPNQLCPLLFATSFVNPDDRAQSGQLVSTGTSKSIASPAMGVKNIGRIMIGAGALVTSKPGRSKDRLKEGREQWNFLKRCYYWLITNSDSKAQAVIDYYTGDQKTRPEAVAPDKFSMWGNFSNSKLYTTPIGILAVALNSGGTPMSVKYYEGCQLQGVGPQLQMGIGAPTTFSGANGIQASYADIKTFTFEESTSLIGSPTGNSGVLMDFLLSYLGD